MGAGESHARPVSGGALPKPAGPYSPGVVTAAPSQLMFVSGQGPFEPASGALPEGGFEAQARQAIANVESVLRAGGFGLGDLVKVEVLLNDLANFEAFNAIYGERIPAPHPARTTSQSDLPGFELSIGGIAARPQDQTEEGN